MMLNAHYNVTISEPEEFRRIEGHKDSVTQCGFSQNDKYFFTADMSGYLQMYELEKETKIWEFEVGDIHWVRWHPLVPILLVGTDDGTIWMWKIPSFETKTIQLSNVGVVCSTFLSTNRHLAVGYMDGTIKIVDLKEGEATVSVETRNEITCIAASKDDSLLVAGDTNAQLHVIASGKLIKLLSNPPDEDEGEDSVEDITFHPSRNLLAASHVGGRVVLWDTALQKVRTVLEHSDGVIKSVWAGENNRHLVTACLDGIIRVWDVDKQEIVTEVTGHKSSILDIKLCNSFVATSSEDSTVKIFKI